AGRGEGGWRGARGGGGAAAGGGGPGGEGRAPGGGRRRGGAVPLLRAPKGRGGGAGPPPAGTGETPQSEILGGFACPLHSTVRASPLVRRARHGSSWCCCTVTAPTATT